MLLYMIIKYQNSQKLIPGPCPLLALYFFLRQTLWSGLNSCPHCHDLEMCISSPGLSFEYQVKHVLMYPLSHLKNILNSTWTKQIHHVPSTNPDQHSLLPNLSEHNGILQLQQLGHHSLSDPVSNPSAVVIFPISIYLSPFLLSPLVLTFIAFHLDGCWSLLTALPTSSQHSSTITGKQCSSNCDDIDINSLQNTQSRHLVNICWLLYFSCKVGCLWSGIWNRKRSSYDHYL